MKEGKSASPKTRKVTSGPLREKERTMNRIVNAVGKVLKKKGYPGLTIANIALEAKVDRKLIYTYFGNLDNLVDLFISKRDYWKTKAKTSIDKLLAQDHISQEEMESLLIGQFNSVMSDATLQRILQWELSQHSESLRKLADEREVVGEQLIQKLEKNITNSDSDIRALLALQTAGLYYLALHANSNGSTFCGLDLHKEEDRERIFQALKRLLKAEIG
ncbi:TetR/AcrR family transcriptional regulator [Sphingobacterium lactis]|uniref:TetR/AcrR family transcriptional regulator n=1 Tax=Sphingobacterium lactis TaxID=797291 RepID=UPI003EC76B12